MLSLIIVFFISTAFASNQNLKKSIIPLWGAFGILIFVIIGYLMFEDVEDTTSSILWHEFLSILISEIIFTTILLMSTNKKKTPHELEQFPIKQKPEQNRKLGHIYIALGWVLTIFGTGILLFYSVIKNLTGIIPSFFAFGCIGAGQAAIIFGKKLRQPFAEEIISSNLGYILLLRAFKRDDTPVDRGWWSESFLTNISYFTKESEKSFEVELVDIFKEIAPIITIGKPGEEIQTLGAARYYVETENWQDKVRELATKAKHIILILDNTDGVSWEIQELEKKHLSKTIMIPPLPDPRMGTAEKLTFIHSIGATLKSKNININFDEDVCAITFNYCKAPSIHKITAKKHVARIKKIAELAKVLN